VAMSESALASALEALPNTLVEASAIVSLTDAYAELAEGAVAGAQALTGAGLALGTAAFSAALVGMSATGQGLVKIPAAVVAFWAAVAGGLATSFAGATAITPPPHATFSASFAALMAANIAGAVTRAQAAASLADLMHTSATTGGTVTYPGPVVSPIL